MWRFVQAPGLGITTSALRMFVPITPAWPIAGISGASSGTTPINSLKEFKEILKKQQATNFRQCRTPSYDVAGTVNVNLQRWNGLESVRLQLDVCVRGPGIVDATVVNALGGLGELR